jgi:hypothetical protein
MVHHQALFLRLHQRLSYGDTAYGEFAGNFALV